MKRLKPSPHWTTGAFEKIVNGYGFEELIEIPGRMSRMWRKIWI